MLAVENREIVNLSKVVKEFYDKGAISPIFYDDYMRKALRAEESSIKPDEPVVVKIPKDINALLQGDFEPAKEIVIKEYPVINGTPFWMGKSRDGVTIQIGYENGDSRFPCSVEFSDKDIHALLAGATGMGKSVALDSVIYGILMKYPPWEVNLTMADAKIVSFKPFADLNFPHIQGIAATGDVDYLISVLEYKYEEMLKMNSVIVASGTGASNIMDLQKFTGLTFPRNFIFVDEFQAMFKGAGRKKQRLQDILDGFARLGRSTGYHLCLASQELGGDIDKNMLNQIKIRMALGCSEAVSTQILGNDEARTLKQKGRLIMNLDPVEANNKHLNVEYRVPYLDPGRIKPWINEAISTLGDRYGHKCDLNFYDEYSVVFENKYPDYIRGFGLEENTIYLGEPCFYCDDPRKVLRVEYRGKSLENITILNNVEKELLRHTKMLKENVLTHKKANNIVLYNDEDFYNDTGLSALKGVKSEMRDTNNMYYKVVLKTVNQRRVMCEVDNKVFINTTSDSNSEERYNTLISKDPQIESLTNKSRCFYLIQYLNSPIGKTEFGLSSLSGDRLIHAENQILYEILKCYVNYGFKDKQITRRDMPPVYIWLLGINKMLGLGRSTNTRIQDEFKRACQDSSLYNMRFIIATETTADMSFFKEVSRYTIMGAVKQRDINGVGAQECFPQTLSGGLAVLYDKDKDDCFKFKKMYLNGEPLV